jgi:hypothetical protein
MLGLVDYGSSSEGEKEETIPKTIITQKESPKVLQKPKKITKKKKLKKSEIFERLGLDKVEEDDEEQLEEDLSYQILKNTKNESEIESSKLTFNKGAFPTSNSHSNIQPASSKDVGSFMNKLNKIVTGEQKIAEASSSQLQTSSLEYTTMPKQSNPFEEKQLNYEEDDFLADPNEYDEEDQIEFTNEEIPSEEEKPEMNPPSIDDMDLPDDVKMKLKNNSIIELTETKEMKQQREDLRRKEMIEKHKKSIYETKEPLKQFSDLEKSKSQLSFLASESRRKAYERAQKKDNSAKNKKNTKHMYGW